MATKNNTVRPHAAPGLYFSESVQTYSNKSIGITTLGVSGETLRGPAFQPISISNWKEFQTYFGGTSTAKFKGSQYPKYELPYIAKSYLEQSNQLEVVRVLGLSGVNAGPAWVITGTKHKVFTGYDYTLMASEPKDVEWNSSNTFANINNAPQPPYVEEVSPDYIRVENHKEWHTLCEDCSGTVDGEYDLTNPEKNNIPDANNTDENLIKVTESYYYKEVEPTGSIEYEDAESLPAATYNSPEHIRIKNETSSTSTDEYKYYDRKAVEYCYEKIDVYDYYQKVWKNNIQLNEEDNCEGNRNNMVVAVLRSRGEHKKAAFVRKPTESDITNGICDDIYSFDGIEYYAKDVKLEPSKSLKLGSSCNPGFSSTTGDFTVDNYNYGTFTIVVDTIYGETKYYSVSLNPEDKNYIYNVIGGSADEGDAEIFVEELYDVALKQLIEDGVINAINSELVKFPTVNIVPQYNDADDLVIESALTKQNKGKRYLYSNELSAGIIVRYTEDGGNTWVEGEGINGVIYNVFERPNATTGKKEYFYGAYAENIEFQYQQLESEPEGVAWIECTQSVTDEIQNSYATQPDFFETPTTQNPEYLRIGDGTSTDYLYYKKIVINFTASKVKNQSTDRLSLYNFSTDVVDGKFTNCVRVIADDMLYVNMKVDENTEDVYPVTLDFNNYKEQYRYASTPWIVSEIKGSAEQVQLAKLFRFHTISDGTSSSSEIKISIENIDPSTGKFDVVVRNFNDVDSNPSIVEKFANCSLIPGQNDYIALKIGSFDESYNAVSKYITVEVNENDVTKASIPAGFLGYPTRNYSGFAVKENDYTYVVMNPQPTSDPTGDVEEVDSVPTTVSDTDSEYIKIKSTGVYYQKKQIPMPKQPYFRFNTDVNDEIKSKKQYFGVSDITGIDIDILSYKGVEAYNNIPAGLTPCFHLDSRILNGTPDKDGKIVNGELEQTVSVDGITGYSWVTVNKNNVTSEGVEPRIGSEEVMTGTIYEDKKFRKFTVAFYGGWDGWDYYRTSRSNTNDFRYKDYKGYVNKTSGYGDMFSVLKNPEAFDLDTTTKALNSDYYAYLAGARQFANPQNIEINVLATPGIDYVNNSELVNDVIDMVEEERADCVYVVTTPDKPFGASDSKDEMFTADEAVSNLEDSDIDSNHTTSYYPWVKYFDGDNSEYIYLPVTRDVVANIALTDNQTWPWYAAAGWNRGTITGTSPKRKLKQNEQDTLYEGRLNYVASFAQEGDRIWGDKNLQISDNQLNRLSTRRLLLRIKKMLQNACIGLLFDPNDNTCSKAVKSAVSTVLDQVMQNRGISDYKIEIDDSPSTRDQGGLGVTYFIRKSNLLEWISFNSVLTGEGMQW